MRTSGITYDTGFISVGTTTREPFDVEVVRREMQTIRDDLHCTAVRVTGGHPLDGDYIRDEQERAREIVELIDIFREEGVDSVFVNTFSSYYLPQRGAGRQGLDLPSAGIVKVLGGTRGTVYPDMPWKPKIAFTAVADAYR